MSTVFICLAVNLPLLAAAFFLLKRQMARSLDATEVLDGIRDEINHLVVQLNQTTDRNVGLTEDCIVRLQKLLDDADRRIALLGRESGKHEMSVRVYDQLKRSAAAAKVAPTAPSDGESAEKRTAAAAEVASADQDKASRVLSLHRQGFDAQIISSRLGATVGEVELIISLSEQRG